MVAVLNVSVRQTNSCLKSKQTKDKQENTPKRKSLIHNLTNTETSDEISLILALVEKYWFQITTS